MSNAKMIEELLKVQAKCLEGKGKKKRLASYKVELSKLVPSQLLKTYNARCRLVIK